MHFRSNSARSMAAVKLIKKYNGGEALLLRLPLPNKFCNFSRAIFSHWNTGNTWNFFPQTTLITCKNPKKVKKNCISNCAGNLSLLTTQIPGHFFHSFLSRPSFNSSTYPGFQVIQTKWQPSTYTATVIRLLLLTYERHIMSSRKCLIE